MRVSRKSTYNRRKNGNRETEAKSCYIACTCHSTSEYDKAKEQKEKGIAIAETFGDKKETEISRPHQLCRKLIVLICYGCCCCCG